MLYEMEKYNIGNTSLVEIESINGNRLFIKMEKENFLGSIKARTAYWIIHDLPKEANKKIIIESTSGNLGLALGYFCGITNRKFMCLVDRSIAKKKLKVLEDNNITYEMVTAQEGMDLRSSRIKRAKELMNCGDYYWVNQYDNPSGIKAHRNTTGPEIWNQINGKIDFCVCAMGSGGTICGISQYLKTKSSSIKICGVEPLGSTIFAEVESAYINAGAGLVGKPGNIVKSNASIDLSFTVSDNDAVFYAQKLYEEYNLAVGITSGMAYAAALRIASIVNNMNIVVIAPDGRESYEEYFV